MPEIQFWGHAMGVTTAPFDPNCFNPKLAAPPPLGWWGRVGNRAYQTAEAVFQAPAFKLIIVEFDDQGRCFHDRDQLHALEAELAKVEQANPVIVTFVHGWRHNARSDDDNLLSFCTLLNDTARELKAGGGADALRPVIGVYVGWRGQSFRWVPFLFGTFWNRKRAGLRVAMGTTRELFERLRQFRKNAVGKGGNPAIVIIGHSFGGLVVFNALSQSLISAAIAPLDEVVPSFANLVLLVNPAFEAVRYLPIHDLVKERSAKGRGLKQEPVFVSVTATNDWATGRIFKWGMYVGSLMENKRTKEEKVTLYHTMGHVDFLRTHELSIPPGSATVAAKRVMFDETNPFWVASATPQVIDGHNGIWLAGFQEWVRDLVAAQLKAPQNPQLYAARIVGPL
jgi:hypothetical protein